MLKKLGKLFDRIEDEVLVTMFIVMVGVIFLQVIMRYVFNNSLTWSEELGKFIFVWISWLGISIGHRRREHIAITMVVDKLGYRAQKTAEVITELILAVICGVTVYYGILMMQVQVPVPYAAIKISTSWGYLSLVLGCSLCLIRALMHMAEAVKCVISGKPVQEGGDA
jgi:TRAP-type C4-dicarboxylate transport system, small permease component